MCIRSELSIKNCFCLEWLFPPSMRKVGIKHHFWLSIYSSVTCTRLSSIAFPSAISSVICFHFPLFWALLLMLFNFYMIPCCIHGPILNVYQPPHQFPHCLYANLMSEYQSALFTITTQEWPSYTSPSLCHGNCPTAHLRWVACSQVPGELTQCGIQQQWIYVQLDIRSYGFKIASFLT